MADAARLGLAGSPTGGIHRNGQTSHGGRRGSGLEFRRALAMAMSGGPSRRVSLRGSGSQTAAVQVPLQTLPSMRVEKSVATIPSHVDAALTQAMTLEGVPQAWQAGLRFIMAQESGGQVGATNPVHSARGLFQLTAANYHLNPNGARSFGNAVEEAQGGIRYIQQRYGTADNAVAFWRQHHWY